MPPSSSQALSSSSATNSTMGLTPIVSEVSMTKALPLGSGKPGDQLLPEAVEVRPIEELWWRPVRSGIGSERSRPALAVLPNGQDRVVAAGEQERRIWLQLDPVVEEHVWEAAR